MKIIQTEKFKDEIWQITSYIRQDNKIKILTIFNQNQKVVKIDD